LTKQDPSLTLQKMPLLSAAAITRQLSEPTPDPGKQTGAVKPHSATVRRMRLHQRIGDGN
jgi:hypothetical protein